MKKPGVCLILTCLLIALLPLQLNAANRSEPISKTVPKPSETSEVKTLELRLNEIKLMDKSDMKSAEKNILRKEVKSINHRLHSIGEGIYLSAGATVFVVILLFILL